MNPASVEQKPSQTALMAALHRAVAHHDYRDESLGPDGLAQVFLPSNYRFLIRFRMLRAGMKNKLETIFPGIHAYIIARTAFFDRVYRQALADEVPQVAVLGAGYDSRAYRFAQLNRATKIIELDATPTQERKKQCLKKANLAIPEWVHLAPIDFHRETVRAVLEKAGYDDRQKTLFLWEGVSYYLTAEAVGVIFDLACESAPGSALAFDYAVSVLERNQDQYGVRQFLQSMQAHHGNERLMFALAEGEIGPYLAPRDLRLVQHLDNAAMEREFLLEGGTPIGRVTAIFRLALAAPTG